MLPEVLLGRFIHLFGWDRVLRNTWQRVTTQMCNHVVDGLLFFLDTLFGSNGFHVSFEQCTSRAKEWRLRIDEEANLLSE